MNEWMAGQTDRQMMDGCLSRWMVEQMMMDGWLDEGVDRWADRQMDDGRMEI